MHRSLANFRQGGTAIAARRAVAFTLAYSDRGISIKARSMRTPAICIAVFIAAFPKPRTIMSGININTRIIKVVMSGFFLNRSRRTPTTTQMQNPIASNPNSDRIPHVSSGLLIKVQINHRIGKPTRHGTRREKTVTSFSTTLPQYLPHTDLKKALHDARENIRRIRPYMFAEQ